MKVFRNIFIGGILLVAFSSCGKDNTITEFRGKVKFETIAVSSKVPGRISTIYVQEGQTVQKGDTLAVLDIPEVNAKLMQAEGAVKAAQGQLNMAYKGATTEQLTQMQGQIDASKAQLEFATGSYERLQAMYADSLISRQQFEEVKMKRDMAKAQLDALQAKQSEIGKSARAEQIDQAKGQLDRALGAKEEVLVASNERFMIAPADMSIETISLKAGELLTPGYTLFNGYKKDSVYFRFTVSESKVNAFEVGKELVLVNPYTKEETEGKIVAIKQLAQYADITSTAPLYDLSESIYELKVIPTSDVSDQAYFLNSTILIK
ncbi:MAG: biotin/lipoyl-binding protein [Balneolaceae bacterium]